MRSLVDTLVAFDFDDTLYKEADYVDSVFREISGGNIVKYEKLKSIGSPYEAFDSLDVESKNAAVELYRSGRVSLDDTEGAFQVLSFFRECGAVIAVVTDGWTCRQKEKINRLGLTGLIDSILVSEEIGADKLSGKAFEILEKCYSGKKNKFYIGDNPAKDFIRANERGWITVMVADDGRNIHSQNLFGLPEKAKPKIIIESLRELFDIIC